MSINNITFLHNIIPNEMFCFSNSMNTIFHFSDSIEVKKFLNNLDIDQVYVVTFEFIYSTLMYNDKTPTINLSKPILITKNSDPNVISNYLKDRIRLACDIHYLEDIALEMHIDSSIVLVNYAKINLF